SRIGADAGTIFTVSSPIGGIVGLTTAGIGTTILSGANTFTGAATIANGITQAANTGAFGLLVGAVTVNSGATLQLTGTVAGKNLTINGPGFGNFAGQAGALAQGALVAVGGSPAWTGALTLTNGSSLGAASGQTFTLSGV